MLQETRSIRRGSPGNPMSEAEQLTKFRDCAARILSPARVTAAEAAIAGLATGGSARDLVALLVPDAA